MTLSTLLLRIALLAVPRGRRARIAEEWEADVAGSAELGLPAIGTALGALQTAVGARFADTLTAARRIARAWSPALIGLAIGAICAVGDISVAVVFISAATIPGSVAGVSRWRRRSKTSAALPQRVV